MVLIDTHCHLDAAEFDANRASVIAEATENDVKMMVVPAVHRSNFEFVSQIAKENPSCVHAFGIHPMYVNQSSTEDLQVLAKLIESQMQTEQPPVAIGEIGLDFFIDGFDKAKQEFFFIEQLKLAKQFELPVILHVRKSIDDILKHLRQHRVTGGIAHAFNGSMQQAEQFIELGFKLGFGGALTYTRALKIRELVSTLPLEAIVLETDAPDIPPEWLEKSEKNSPKQVVKIAKEIALLRRIPCAQVAEITTKNSMQILPKMAKLFTRPQVLL
jgi:TatD DNase family protein